MKKKINKSCALLLAISFLFLARAEGEEVLIKLKVVTEQANIRLKPAIGSIIIKQVPQGTTLESTKKEGEWYLIKLKPDEEDRVSGYVHESMVIVLEGPPIEKEKKEIREELEEREKIEEIPLPQPVVPTPPARQPSKSLFELYFSLGGSYISGGDLNRGIQGLADYHSDLLADRGTGEVNATHLSYILGGELTFPLSSRFLLGLGADYFLRERESVVEFQEGPSTETLILRPKIQAFPLRLVISYYPFPSFYVKSGIEYYFAKYAYLYRSLRLGLWEQWQGEAEAQGFGFVAGFGYELRLSSVFSFIVEATGRYAKIKGFKGKDRFQDSTGLDRTEEGTLYIYNKGTSQENSYPNLFIRKDKPTEANVFDPRKAVINFSGFSLKTGFKIKF